MPSSGLIAEVFSSLQGEGLYIGYRQVFIRLAGCIFDCPYCDTEYTAQGHFDLGGARVLNPVDPSELAERVVKAYEPSLIHSYSFTGGEPLAQIDFLMECGLSLKKLSGKKLFLETSGLIPSGILECDGLFDIMSIDIKTHSEEVLKNIPVLLGAVNNLKKSEYYLKLLIEEGFQNDVLTFVTNNMVENGIKNIIIQPVDNKISENVVNSLFNNFYKHGIEARIIPQSHKLLNVR